jgi:hypothetical protein
VKISILIITMALLAAVPPLAISKAEGFASIELTPTESHHVAKLNSDQPYVAGFHVIAEDLRVLDSVDATAITVSFPSTETSHFPSASWLGAGMFVQAQDHFFRNVDYGFYTMLVVDAQSNLFIDLGLHQTRESTPPLHMPTSEIMYAYTWRMSGVDLATPVTLFARWTSDGFVHYSISASGNNVTLTSVNVAGLPNCENIIRDFFVGNWVVDQFPFSRYVDYFQFGVVSPEIIADTHWTVHLREPKMLKGTEWAPVSEAWSVEGAISYLDWDWKWGGAPYFGVDAQSYNDPLENPHEVVFLYNGRSLIPGRVLWENHYSSNVDDTAATASLSLDQTFIARLTYIFPINLVVLAIFSQRLECKVREAIARCASKRSSPLDVRSDSVC